MKSIEYITNELKKQMKMNIPDEGQYKTWIDIIQPLNLYKDVIYLEIDKSEDMIFIYKQLWVPQLQACLDKINKEEGTNLKIDVVAKDSDQYEKILALGRNTDENGQLVMDAVKSYPRPILNPTYTFENFVQGKSNAFALTVAESVAKNASRSEVIRSYNPLFIYGASGLGKTHLMQAIAHRVLENRDDAYVMYISSEKFTNELITSLGKRQMPAFKEKYRSADILLIDDIQFISGKESTQEELFHTFEDLYNSGKQIVISSDKPPKEINDLEDRLVTRFGWGLLADISKPDFETRVAILQKKLEEIGVDVDNNILEYIAENIDTNIRDLEGALSTAIACAKSDGRITVTIDDALQGVESRVSDKKVKRLTIKDIQGAVANKYNIKLNDLKGKSRKKEIVIPRQIAMYLCRELLSTSLVSIANEFNRDHTTIMHGYEKIEVEMQESEILRQDIEDLIKELK
ncbi:MAG: chromosomal replication initiator protein DnaA [Peptoniphilaceae bacterium]|nr:chromosomal replication initiator protein DnaA [Peptoniphilaceae bacterium]MDY6018910.1 chromosomal replication initiator protein DnaA [Anaerococcus sp.]